MNHTLASGQFIAQHDVSSRSLTVVLGPETASALFGTQDPVGQTIKYKGLPLHRDRDSGSGGRLQ